MEKEIVKERSLDWQRLFDVLFLIKAAIGITIIYKATELYNTGYINDGLVTIFTIIISNSPELVTWLFFIMVGLKCIR